MVCLDPVTAPSYQAQRACRLYVEANGIIKMAWLNNSKIENKAKEITFKFYCVQSITDWELERVSKTQLITLV